jgi:hypothetical protein
MPQSSSVAPSESPSIPGAADQPAPDSGTEAQPAPAIGESPEEAAPKSESAIDVDPDVAGPSVISPSDQPASKSPITASTVVASDRSSSANSQADLVVPADKQTTSEPSIVVASHEPPAKASSNIVSSEQSSSVHSQAEIVVPADDRVRVRSEPSIVVAAEDMPHIKPLSIVSSDQSPVVHSQSAIVVPIDDRAHPTSEPSIVIASDARPSVPSPAKPPPSPPPRPISSPAITPPPVTPPRAANGAVKPTSSPAITPPPLVPKPGPPVKAAVSSFDDLVSPSVVAPASGTRSGRGLWLGLIALVALGGVGAVVLLGKSESKRPIATNDRLVDKPIDTLVDNPIVEPAGRDTATPDAMIQDDEIEIDDPGTPGTTSTGTTRPGGTARPGGTMRPGGTTGTGTTGTGTTRPGGTTITGTTSTGTASTKPGGATTTGSTSSTSAVSADGCDKVSCVIDNFARPCCEQFRPRKAGELPYDLDKAMITAGIGKAKAAVIRCGEQSQAKGIVKIAVEVTGEGGVGVATVAESPDPALGECVASAVRKVSFAKTATGGTFTYPFKF